MSQSSTDSPKPERKPPRNYFARREQLRLMMLVGSLGLVMLLMMRAADPETWRWIAPADQENAENSPDSQAPVAPPDTRVARQAVAGDNGTEGEFRVASNTRPATPYTLGSKGNEKQEASQGELWGDEASLAMVEDNSPFRAGDFEAWSQIFDRLRDATPRELSAKNALRVQFGQLFQQSKLYRGKLVTLTGVVRRCVKIPPNKLDERAGDLWQLWLFSAGDNAPIVIYAMNVPEGFPVGNQIHEELTCQAVYFKKWVYGAKGGTMTAPLLLARNVNWEAKEQTERQFTGSEFVIGLITTFIAAAGVIGFIWWNSRNKDSEAEKLVRQRNRKRFEEQSDELNVGVSVRDQLGALSAKMQDTSSPPDADDKPSS